MAWSGNTSGLEATGFPPGRPATIGFALMANYIWYITPVPSAKPIVEGLPGGKPVASSPLVFPDQAMLDKTHQYYVYTGTTDLDQWNNTFDPIITG